MARQPRQPQVKLTTILALQQDGVKFLHDRAGESCYLYTRHSQVPNWSTSGRLLEVTNYSYKVTSGGSEDLIWTMTSGVHEQLQPEYILIYFSKTGEIGYSKWSIDWEVTTNKYQTSVLGVPVGSIWRLLPEASEPGGSTKA